MVITDTGCAEADEVPHVFTAVTEMLPLVALAVVLIEFVVEVPVHPVGNVQLKEVAPLTGVTLYVLVDPEQIVVVPLIVPGVAGMVITDTSCDEADEVPHVFTAVTEMLPLVVLAVVLIEFVVEVPTHPAGNVQL